MQRLIKMIFIDGYCMVHKFLDNIYWKYQYDYLGALLGGMSLLEDNGTADPAYERDWDIAVGKAFDESRAHNYTPELAYKAAIIFLESWLETGSDEDIRKVCDGMKKGKFTDLWNDSIENFGKPYLMLNGDNS